MGFMDLARLWREWYLLTLTYHKEFGSFVDASYHHIICEKTYEKDVEVSIEVYHIMDEVSKCLEDILRSFARSMCSELIKLIPTSLNIHVSVRDNILCIKEKVRVENSNRRYVFNLGFKCDGEDSRYLHCDRFVRVEVYDNEGYFVDHFKSEEGGYNLSYDVMMDIYRKLPDDVKDILDGETVDKLVKSLILFSERFYELGKHIKDDVALCELYP